MLHLLTPHYRVSSVLDLTAERLRQWGFRVLLLDVDCTLKRYRRDDPSPEVIAWIEQRRLDGFTMCLVSNGLGRRIRRLAERLDLPCVVRAMKPFPWGVASAMKRLDAMPYETVMIGDQVFADVIAGRWAGVRTILVDPIHPEEEQWFTRLKRIPERMVLAWVTP